MRASLTPSLIFSERPLLDLLEQRVLPNTLLIADAFNVDLLERFPNGEVIGACDGEHVESVTSRHDFTHVLAVGGCSALDFGRSCATRRRATVSLVPTILSTSCISVNRSVEWWGREHRSVETPIPNECVVSFEALRRGGKEALGHWTASGLGDLFANISATITALSAECELDGLDVAQLEAAAPEPFAAMDRIEREYRLEEDATLQWIAELLDAASRRVIELGSTASSAGVEHDLFYEVCHHSGYLPYVQTHGKLVAVGTMIVLDAHARARKDWSLIDRVRRSFATVGLPVTSGHLRAMHVDPSDLAKGILALPAGSILRRGASEAGGPLALVRRAFR